MQYIYECYLKHLLSAKTNENNFIIFKNFAFCTKDNILAVIKAHLMFVRRVFWRVSKNSTMSLMSVLW